MSETLVRAMPPHTQQRHISDVVALIHHLTGRAIRLESLPELFMTALHSLFDTVPFDVGVAVVLEQNLDLYIFTRAGSESLVTEELVGRIRENLQARVPVSFADPVVKSEMHDLAGREGEPQPLEHEHHALLTVENRIAGLLSVFRHEPFPEDERHMIDILASQVSLLLASLSSREAIQKLADSDDLIGIWNKRWFLKRLSQEVERARAYHEPLSLVMFDVDDFKQINDSFGHTIGDVVLSELCGAVRETLRPPDIFARFGGDEFAILLPHTDVAGARALAQRILDTCGNLIIPTDEEGSIRCSVSIGVSEFEHGDSTADDLLRQADDRLYLSKRDGKNRYTAANA